MERSVFTRAILALTVSACGQSYESGRSLIKQRHHHRSSRIVGSSQSSIEHFVIEYGDGSNWYTGVIGQDTINLGGAISSEQQFGMIEFGVNPIGNPLPDDNGQPSTDGIMGLNPGCLNDNICSGGADDVISSLVKSGALAHWGFTMCHSERGGGKLFLGLPKDNAVYPDATHWVPLQPFSSQTNNGTGSSWFVLAPPKDKSASNFFFGGKLVGSAAAEEISVIGYMFDSGTMGLEVPPQVAKAVFGTIAKRWLANEEIKTALVKAELPAELDELTEGLMNGSLSKTPFSKEAAGLMGQMVPDFVMSTSGVNITISGSTSLFQDTECSGTYSQSWRAADDNPSTIAIGGTAFLWGKTLTHDVSDINSPRMGILDSAGDCDIDYSPNSYILEMSGSEGQVFSQGVYTADVSLGTPAQTFVLQIDTGSDDLLVQSNSCVLFDADCVAFEQEEDNLMNFSSTGQCNGVNDKALSHSPQTNVSFESFELFAAASLEPVMTCEEKRKICGDLTLFNSSKSTTFQALPKEAHVSQHHFTHPPKGGDMSHVVCNPCSVSETGMSSDSIII